MRRFLMCSGTQGRPEALLRLEALVRERQPDGVLFAGGVLARPREYAPSSGTEFGYTKDEASYVEQFFVTLGRLGVFTAIIPGVFDAPLEQFFQLGMEAERAHPLLHLVHGTPAEEKGVTVFGLGGCIDGYTNTNIGYYSQRLAEYYLRPLLRARRSRTILLLAEPPQSWHGEAEDHGLLEALLTTYQPQVCVVGTNGGQSVERVGRTLLVSPGPLSGGCAAWIDCGRRGEAQVELLSPCEAAT